MNISTAKIVILFLLANIFSTNLISQSNKDKLLKEFLHELSEEVKAKTTKSSADANVIREKMLAIVNAKGYDKTAIFGKDDKYFKEGMSAHFKSRPAETYINLHTTRLKAKELEKLHNQLYDLDFKLQLAKKITKFIKEKGNSINISKAFFRLNTKALGRKSSKEMLANIILESYYHPKGTFFTQKPKNDQLLENTNCEVDYQCPGESDYRPTGKLLIRASNPYDGQYNFHFQTGHDEMNLGYINLEGKIPPNIFDTPENFIIKWTATNYDYIFTKTRYDYASRNLYFLTPVSFLKLGHIYKIELVTLGNNIPKQSRSIYFRKDNLFDALTRHKKISAKYKFYEQLTAPIYFRVSSFKDSFTKSILIFPDMTVNDLFDFEVSIPEPFDEVELKGTACSKPSVSFNAYYHGPKTIIDNIFSNRVAYYLTVPTIEQIDVNDINRPYTAFLDNTYGEWDIINADNKFANSYTKKLKREKLPDLFVEQNVTVKKITESRFRSGNIPVYNDVKLTFLFSDYLSIYETYPGILQNILKRRDRRAEYYYKLHVVDSKRKNKQPEHNLEFFRQREDKILQSIIDKNYEFFDIKLTAKKEQRLTITNKTPFCSRATGISTIKLKRE